MAAIWLRFLAPGDFFNAPRFSLRVFRALSRLRSFGSVSRARSVAIIRHRTRVTGLLFLTGALYLLFFETLVWLNYTTLEVRFLMYPGLPLLVFASSRAVLAFHGCEQNFAPWRKRWAGIVRGWCCA